MNEIKPEIRLSFVPGLQEIVAGELGKDPRFFVREKSTDSIYIDFVDDFRLLKELRSVSRAYLVLRGSKYNPLYVSNHKSLLGGLIETVLQKNESGAFKTFKITCAGSDSPEVKEIARYLEEAFSVSKAEEADLKVHIVKIHDVWEVGLQVTPRPLSFRSYRAKHMSGAMDPTIAYALNSLCDLDQAKTYLNVFSGSATLLIEAAQCHANLETLIGFDSDKERLSLSIQNIRRAGLIQKIQIKEGDVFDSPDFGKFDVIVSDLPFGMAISKHQDLEKLYGTFVEYAENHLNSGGRVGVYTSQSHTFERAVRNSRFTIIQTADVQLITSEEEYLPTKIFVLALQR